MIVHIDCNSFYASCEIAFRPDLQGKPVVVANCNEAGGGIILALTAEAKKIGLKRGDPVFKVKQVIENNGVAVFPANLQKYVDISRRIMQIVQEQEIVQHFTQYSVDEFFGVIPIDEPCSVRSYLERVSEAITRGTGIPVGCGASLSYTLAKVATYYAKHYKAYNKICVLPKDKIKIALSKLPIGEVWGIGRASVYKLQNAGINNALDFIDKSESYIKSRMGITGVRTWRELRGTPCIDISNPAQQRTIMHSRTFTYMAKDFDTLKTYISNYAAAAARKLRDQKSVCKSVGVFIATNPHREDLDQYGDGATTELVTPTADTMEILKAAVNLLNRVFKPGFQYKKAGIILSDITSDKAIQMDLFTSSPKTTVLQRRLMAATDTINAKFGMDKVRMASQGNEKSDLYLKGFQPLKNQTTNIDDIIKINCKK